ncbi:MAG: GNAT family N-acetyltransferase [Desulfobacterales bacterium]
MKTVSSGSWKQRIVEPYEVLRKIRPGMNIFLSTGAAEPRTLVRRLLDSTDYHVHDLELTQLVSFGDAICLEEICYLKYHLKTFFAGWVSSDAITAGRIDLIPSRFSMVPRLIESGLIDIDASFVQVTPPNDAGYCSLGAAVDVARLAMEKARLVVGEINEKMPFTYGDTFIPISEFDYLVKAEYPPHYFERWPVNDVFDKAAQHVASLIDHRSCVGFSIGPLFDALTPYLAKKKHLGIHSPFFTDALMDLVNSGAVTNRYKELYRGKSLASYAMGTKELFDWLDHNPLVEFQGIDKVYNPLKIGQNPQFIAILPARKVDLSGKIALHIGKGNVATGPAEVMDFFSGAQISPGGRCIFALSSRNLEGKPNILLSVDKYPNRFSLKESVDIVVTEYGFASLTGHSLRERAQAMIDIAHPDDRPELIEQAKKAKVLYADQIFIPGSANLYPREIATEQTFKGGIKIRFRAIKPSDEEGMRRLFYRFSEKQVYERFFRRIRTMPHPKMQEYINVDWNQVMSVVGLVGMPGKGKIVAEARYIRERNRPYAEVAFLVDEAYQGIGIGSYLYRLLMKHAKEQGVEGFSAEVLFSNIGMMKVFKKCADRVEAKLENGVYELKIPFDSLSSP